MLHAGQQKITANAYLISKTTFLTTNPFLSYVTSMGMSFQIKPWGLLMRISVFHLIWCDPQALVINSFQQEQLLPWRNYCPSLSLETKNIILEVLLVLTKPSSTVCGCTVFLMVFTLVGFKTVPVGVLIFACVAKQGGSWKEYTWHTSVALAMPSWEESVKSHVPFWKIKSTCYKWVFMASEIRGWFWLMKLKRQAKEENKFSLFTLDFWWLNLKTHFSGSAVLSCDFSSRLSSISPMFYAGLVGSQSAEAELGIV